MTNRTSKSFLSIILVLSLFTLGSQSAYATLFDPVPFENRNLGKNSNAYNPMTVRPTLQQQERFIKEVAPYAVRASEQWGVPASAIIGMAILESGYGTTRTAYYANNLFGIKIWGYNPQGAWQLKGQPDEDFERPVRILESLGPDRLIFDESQRRDNWYRQFNSYQDAVNFLAGTLLQNHRYGFAREKYQSNLENDMSIENASRQYLFDIAHAGYNHLGGNYYRDTVGLIMKQWNLFEYDRMANGSIFRDVFGHWAEESILLANEKGWLNGHSDQTFRPNNHLTRAQAASILTNFLNLQSNSTTIHFNDISNDFWARTAVILVAQNEIMNGTGDGNFSPSTNVTRAQVAQIFYNVGFYTELAQSETRAFTDVSDDHWALVAIETMQHEGILNGYPDGTFKPNQPITRAQMAAIIHRIYDWDGGTR